MATIAPPPPAPPSPARGPQNRSNGADQLINGRIEDARRSLWWAELIRNGLKLAIASIVAVFFWLVIDQWVYSPNVAIRCVVFVGLLGLASLYLKRRVLPLFRSTVCPDYAARALERNLPELRHSLTSYVTLRQEGQKSDLQTRVVRSMGSLTAGRLKNHNELPEEAVGNFRWWIATAVAFAIVLGYSVVSPKNAWQSLQRLAVPVASISPAHRVTISDVLPGDIEAVAGRDVEIGATIIGLRAEESVTCQWDLPAGREELELNLNTDSNRFVGRLQLPHTASGVVPYTITAGDATAGPFRLRVQDLPVVALESVKYQPPQYTGESPHTSSSGSIAGLAGTQVRILATTNRPVTKARIEFNPRLRGDRVQATAGAKELTISEDGTSLSFVFTLRTAAGRSAAVEQDSYRIVVHDSNDQRNSEPIVYPIRIVSDLPPEVSITMPFQSPQKVPIDAQQIIEVHASDPDYGLKHVQLRIRTSLNLIAEPVLWSDIAGQKGNQVSEYRFRPAEHNLPIGSSVQIVAVATDNRMSDETVKLEPNVTRSDPIEIKITAASRLPEPDDPNADGLSEPDNRPASDHEDTENQGKEQSNNKQQGSGGSGGSEGADSQNGDQQGGDSTSKQGNSKGEQSSDQQNHQGGNGQDRGDQESEPSDSDTSDKGENSSGSEKGNSSSKDQSNENSKGGGNSEKQGEQTNNSENPENGSNPSEENQSQNNDGQGSDKADGGPQKNQGGQTSDTNTQQSGDPSASQPTGDTGNSSKQSPEHDGEAFERIRDFLEEKRKQQQRNNQESGNQESGNQESGNQESGNQEAGNQEAGNQESGNQEAGNQEAGNQEAGNQESGNQESGNQEAGNPKPDNKPDNADRQSKSDSGAGTSQAGSGTGGNAKGEASESPIPPDPVNVDYAKKATDMVLDYLEETRDAPDQDLLDQLNWSEDDLERFADRWQKVRKIPDAPIHGHNQEIEDALKSLGLRTPASQTNQIRESADSLQGIRDSGNRQPPPAAYRDAFDAFRRAMGRGK